MSDVSYGVCAICEAPLPRPRKPSELRVICDSRECISEARRYAGRIGVRYRARNWDARIAARTSYTCPKCGIEKPMTLEHFSPRKLDPDTGEVLRWRSWCRDCKRTDDKERYWSNPERRLTRMEEHSIRYRLKAEQEGRTVLQRPMVRRLELMAQQRRSGRVPSGPLVAVIEAEAKRCAAVDGSSDESFQMACERLGIDDSQVRKWRRALGLPSGEARTAAFEVADRILSLCGLLWFDVYDESNTSPDDLERVRQAFEGKERQAA